LGAKVDNNGSTCWNVTLKKVGEKSPETSSEWHKTAKSPTTNHTKLRRGIHGKEERRKEGGIREHDKKSPEEAREQTVLQGSWESYKGVLICATIREGEQQGRRKMLGRPQSSGKRNN